MKKCILCIHNNGIVGHAEWSQLAWRQKLEEQLEAVTIIKW